MKKLCLILTLCLLLGCMSGCGVGEAPTQATTVPTETTQPEPTTEPTVETTEATEPTQPKIIGYDLDIPEGFEIKTSEDDRAIYLTEEDTDLSSIVIRTQPLDEGVLEMDEEGFQNMQALEQEYEALTLETLQLDSEDALFADYVVIREDVRIHILEYIVVGSEQNYVFQFSDYTEEETWLDAFAACADSINLLMENEGITPDYSHLQRYELPCGISLYAVPGMEPQDAPGFSGCIGSREAIILVMKDDKQENNLSELSLSGYAALVSHSNELDPFTQDNYGNLHVNFYSSDSLGMRYYNNLTVSETEDSFWVIQMTCTAANQAAYDREFALWATSIQGN